MLPREELFFRILIFFSLFTGVVGVINLAAGGSFSIGDLGLMVSGGGNTGQIPGQMTLGGSLAPYTEGANTADGVSLTGVDFTVAAIVNQNVTSKIGGPWTLTPGTGLVLSNVPILPSFMSPNLVVLRNTKSTDSTYDVSVLVDNSVAGGTFYVYPRIVSVEASQLISSYDLRMEFSADGIHLKKFPPIGGIIDAGDDYFYPMPGASTTIIGGSTIRTTLTEVPSTVSGSNPDKSSILTVWKDGTLLFTTNVRSIFTGAVSNDRVRHGSAGSDYINFVVKGFPSTNLLSTSATLISGSGSVFDWIGGFLGGVFDAMKIAGGFLSLIGAALGLSGTSLVPFWFWAIVGLPCIAVMIMIYIEIARGV